MKLLNFRALVLIAITLVLGSSRESAAASYCPGCVAGIVGAGVALGAGVGTAIYFVHRSHTSLTGCVEQTQRGFSLTAKDGNAYELVNAPNEVKDHQRLSLRGHKLKTASGRAFRVDRISRDLGSCDR